jgi:hypothetical protein
MPPGWKDGKVGRQVGRPGQLYGDSPPPGEPDSEQGNTIRQQEDVQVRGKSGREMVMQVIYRGHKCDLLTNTNWICRFGLTHLLDRD